MKTLKVVCIGLLVTLLGLAGSAGAFDGWGRHGGAHHRGAFGFAEIVRSLDLTEAQKDAVADILEQYRQPRRELHDQIRDARRQLAQTVHSDIYDEAVVREAAGALSARITESALMRARIQKDIRAVLTPEQLNTLAEQRVKHRDRMKCMENCRGESS